MLYIKCKELNRNGCNFVARGNTKWDVKLHMLDHHAKEHPEKIRETDSNQRSKLIKKMNKHITK